MKILWRALGLCLIAVLLLAVPAFAEETTLPGGFYGVDSVSLSKEGEAYSWRLMTQKTWDEEEQIIEEGDDTIFGVDYAENTYIAGNSGVAQKAVSNIAVTVHAAGQLTFDYVVKTTTARTGFLGWRVNSPISIEETQSSLKGNAAYGKDGVSGTATLNVSESDIGSQGTATIYIAFCNTDIDASKNPLNNYALVSNVRYIGGARSDVVRWDSSKGSVKVEQFVSTPSGFSVPYYTYPEVSADSLQIGQSYRLNVTPASGYQFYGWIRHYTYNGTERTSVVPMTDQRKGNKYDTDKTTGEITGVYNNDVTLAAYETEVTVNETDWLEAIIAPTGTYAFRINATYYDNSADVTQCISNASSGDVIVLLKDTVLNSSVTVKRGVTLYVPFREAWAQKDEAAGLYRHNGGTKNAFGGTNYLTLSIPEGVTLTVKGTLAVGSVTGAATQGMQGHISGAYGKIANDGSIVISENGTMITYGLVTGSGVVKAENYGIVKEPLVICDFAGGSNTLALYTDQQMPFKRFATQNIQCELQLERYGTLTGLINLYALGGFNEVEADVVGVTSQSIFLPNDTGVSGSDIILSRTYAPEYLDSGVGQSSGIGKTTWNVYGGLVFRNLTLDLGMAVITMDHVDFAIPPHMDFVMHDGLYDIPGKVKIMPGAHMTVAADATLKITGKLIVLDGLKQEAMSGYKYPTREQLSVPGYGGSGEFILNGTLRITEGSTLGGVIQSTSDTGVLIIEEGTYLKNSTADLGALDPAAAVDLDVSLARQIIPETDTWAVEEVGSDGYSTFYNWVQQDGGKGGYADNTTWFNLPARVYNGTEMVELTPGTWKSSVASHTFIDTSEQRYCSNGKSITAEAYTNARVMTYYEDTFERTVQGSWGESTSAVEITSNTVAGSDKAGSLTNGVTMDAVTVRNSDGSTTLTLKAMKGETPATEKYVHLVKYVTATGTLTATGTNGVYTIPAEGLSVTIETALLGDVNGDGQIKLADVRNVYKACSNADYLGTLTDLQKLCVDIDANGKIRIADARTLYRFVSGSLQSL